MPHGRLISKLRGYGVKGKFMKCIEIEKLVILNGYAVDWVEVLSGVPQGSFLG